MNDISAHVESHFWAKYVTAMMCLFHNSDSLGENIMVARLSPRLSIKIWATRSPPPAKSQPYTLHVTTNVDESGDAKNLGFALNFRQNLC